MSEIKVDVGVGKFRASLTVKAGESALRDDSRHRASFALLRSHLMWVLPGPDARYNPGIAYVAVDDCDSFARDVALGWDQYQALVAAAPRGIEVTKNVVIENRSFRLVTGSGYSAGLTLFPHATHSYRLLIKSQQELQQFVQVLREAQRRTIELQPLL